MSNLSQLRLTALNELMTELSLPDKRDEKTLGLINEALTHSSYKADHKGSVDYERLEFFGDSVLKFVVSEYLFNRFPNYSEGRLTEIRAVLVSGQTLNQIGTHLQLGKHIILGRGIHLKQSMIGRSLEALFGAVYLAYDMQTARLLIESLLSEKAEAIHENASQENFKAQLQELTQGQAKGAPVYATSAVEGPAHDPIFSVTVAVQGEVIASGSGPSKKQAEQQAAKAALEILLKRSS
ncbi:MAG: ribonuclease III [Candidatus Obscuribacterales bacterium]|nr:ribonuclease III [Candidatus Obscuribacterales bacterium]